MTVDFVHFDGLSGAQWLGQDVVGRRWSEMVENDGVIEQLFSVLVSRYDQSGALKEQLGELKSRWQRVQFVQSNRAQLANVARCEQGAASAIMHIVQRTEHIAECIGFAVR